jgi:hypothetical protein
MPSHMVEILTLYRVLISSWKILAHSPNTLNEAKVLYLGYNDMVKKPSHATVLLQGKSIYLTTLMGSSSRYSVGGTIVCRAMYSFTLFARCCWHLFKKVLCQLHRQFFLITFLKFLKGYLLSLSIVLRLAELAVLRICSIFVLPDAIKNRRGVQDMSSFNILLLMRCRFVEIIG